MFIECTNSGFPRIINTRRIAFVIKDGSTGSLIYFSGVDGDTLYVDESPDEVLKMIQTVDWTDKYDAALAAAQLRHAP